MTPVTGGIARGDQQGLILPDRMVQYFAAPLLPPHGIPRVLQEVWRCRPVKVVPAKTVPFVGFPDHLPPFSSQVTETMISFSISVYFILLVIEQMSSK
jgi:hypothetical protein